MNTQAAHATLEGRAVWLWVLAEKARTSEGSVAIELQRSLAEIDLNAKAPEMTDRIREKEAGVFRLCAKTSQQLSNSAEGSKALSGLSKNLGGTAFNEKLTILEMGIEW